MSGIIKVFLLLAAAICISKARVNRGGQQCLCERVRNQMLRSGVKDIHIYPATTFCDRVEIVVTAHNNFRYCLDPKLERVKKLLANIIKNNIAAATNRQAVTASNQGSTTHI